MKPTLLGPPDTANLCHAPGEEMFYEVPTHNETENEATSTLSVSVKHARLSKTLRLIHENGFCRKRNLLTLMPNGIT